MRHNFLSARARSLEGIFFMRNDATLLEKQRELQKMQETKKVLSEVSGIKNDAVLKKLVDLNVTPDVLASIAVVPLIEVAWADGEVDEKERSAILAGARKAGMVKDSANYTLLDQWLKHRPPPKMLEAWQHYMRGLCDALTQEEHAALKRELCAHAEAVAKASGSFFGITSGISEAEQKMLKKLEATCHI